MADGQASWKREDDDEDGDEELDEKVCRIYLYLEGASHNRLNLIVFLFAELRNPERCHNPGN